MNGSAADAATFEAEFDFELDPRDQPRVPVVSFALDPDRLFATSDSESGLDFTFVATSPDSRGTRQPIRDFGWIPLDAGGNGKNGNGKSPRIDRAALAASMTALASALQTFAGYVDQKDLDEASDRP